MFGRYKKYTYTADYAKPNVFECYRAYLVHTPDKECERFNLFTGGIHPSYFWYCRKDKGHIYTAAQAETVYKKVIENE